MGLVSKVEIRLLTSMKSGMSEFYTPQSSHETMLVQVAGGSNDDLFVHHFQTDQLFVVRREFVLVVLQNRTYQYIPLSDRYPSVVKVPAGIPHAAINFSDEPCLVVNAVLRHGKPHERDYRPVRRPFPYDLSAAKAALDELACPISA